MLAPTISHRLSSPNPNDHAAQTSSSSSSSSAMVATLPPVDFGFDALKDRMAAFTLRFDEFIECGRKRILEEKNEFAKSMAEDKGKPTPLPSSRRG
jgi:kinetochore protein Spc25